MISVRPRPDPDGNIKRLGSDYSFNKHIHDLEGHARRFHEVAAEVAGLSLRDLVRTVYKLEQLLLRWQSNEKRRLRDEVGSQEMA